MQEDIPDTSVSAPHFIFAGDQMLFDVSKYFCIQIPESKEQNKTNRNPYKNLYIHTTILKRMFFDQIYFIEQFPISIYDDVSEFTAPDTI